MIEKKILDKVRSSFEESIIDIESLSGGSINDVYKIVTNNSSYCLKINRSNLFPDFFLKEVNGLNELRKAADIRVPKLFTYTDDQTQSFLLIDYISSKVPNSEDWEKAGIALANLHKIKNNEFGFYEDNFIGSLQQSNNLMTNWVDFYRQERLEKQFTLASKSSLFNREEIRKFIRFLDKLEELLFCEKASLLHGDLWSGNYFFSDKSELVLIDPAVYYGNREVDIAMSKLFGSANQLFYNAYHQQFELEPGWLDRIKLYQLYPILVHINLFGSSYINQYKEIINHYI